MIYRAIIALVLLALAPLASPVFGPLWAQPKSEEYQIFSTSEPSENMLVIIYADAKGVRHSILTYSVSINGTSFHCKGPTGTSIIPSISLIDMHMLFIF